MKKKAILILSALLLIAVAFGGCSAQKASTTKLSSAFDETKVKATAEAAVKLINAGEYQKLSDTMVQADLRSKLTADVLKDAVNKTMSNAGAFESFGNETVVGTVDSAKNANATCVVPAKYKNQTVTYTISFDTNMAISGLYMK